MWKIRPGNSSGNWRRNAGNWRPNAGNWRPAPIAPAQPLKHASRQVFYGPKEVSKWRPPGLLALSGNPGKAWTEGGGILSDVAQRGVVKTEDEQDEEEILKQIQAAYPKPQTLNPSREAKHKHPLIQVLKKKQALLREAKAGL